MNEKLISLIVGVFVVLVCLPVHEAAHAFAANRLGDDTARNMGRLTLNPIKHIDPIGAVMLIMSSLVGFGFGWAKPVPINPNNFKNRKLGMGLSALAGPVSNFLMAYIFMVAMKLTVVFGGSPPVVMFLYYAVLLNIGLAVFNFLPIPPLDGSRIVLLVLPEKTYFGIMKYEKIIAGVLMILILSGILSPAIGFLNGGMNKLLDILTGYLGRIY